MNFQSLLKVFPILLLTITLSSCGHLLHLNNAQDVFNKGANFENREKFGLSIGDISPGNYYNLAYAEVQQALRQKGKLAKDGVLASAYTIKALCEWKLHRHGQASQTAKLALQEMNKNESAGIYMPRDKAVMQAIDWLVAIDESNSAIGIILSDSTRTLPDIKYEYKSYIFNDSGEDYGKIELALERLEGIKASVSNNNQTIVYLHLAQMAGMKVWSDALNAFKQQVDQRKNLPEVDRKAYLDWYKTQRRTYADQKRDQLEALSGFLPEQEESPIYKFWEVIL